MDASAACGGMLAETLRFDLSRTGEPMITDQTADLRFQFMIVGELVGSVAIHSWTVNLFEIDGWTAVRKIHSLSVNVRYFAGAKCHVGERCS